MNTKKKKKSEIRARKMVKDGIVGMDVGIDPALGVSMEIDGWRVDLQIKNGEVQLYAPEGGIVVCPRSGNVVAVKSERSV